MAAPATILRLPNELITYILSLADQRDVAFCALTCRRIHSISIPHLYRLPTPRSIQSLTRLARTVSTTPDYAQQLTALSLSETNKRWLYDHVEPLSDAIDTIAQHAPGITTVDLSHANFLPEKTVITVTTSLGTSLRCVYLDELRITDLSILALVHHCPNITDLSLVNVLDISDTSVFEMADRWMNTLEFLNMTNNPTITWNSIDRLLKKAQKLRYIDISGVYIEWEWADSVWTPEIRAEWVERGITVIMDPPPENSIEDEQINGPDGIDSDSDNIDDDDDDSDQEVVYSDFDHSMGLIDPHNFPLEVTSIVQQYMNDEMELVPDHELSSRPIITDVIFNHDRNQSSGDNEDDEQWTDEEVYEGDMTDSMLSS